MPHARRATQTGKVQLEGGDLLWGGVIPSLPLPVNAALTVAAFAVLEGFRSSGEEVGTPAIFPDGALHARRCRRASCCRAHGGRLVTPLLIQA